MREGSASTIWTIGYEGRDIQEFVAVLVDAGVEVLADVRELPLSRKRGFSKTALGLALGDAGLAYMHLRPLGNPKSNREPFRQDEPGARERFVEHMNNGSRPAFDGLAEGAAERKTALMCFEREHGDCHRSCIAEQLVREFGMSVVTL